MGIALEHIGSYVQLLREVFKRPQRHRMFIRELIREVYVQGLAPFGLWYWSHSF